jgi:hypothetical protein
MNKVDILIRQAVFPIPGGTVAEVAWLFIGLLKCRDDVPGDAATIEYQPLGFEAFLTKRCISDHYRACRKRPPRTLRCGTSTLRNFPHAYVDDSE